MNVHLNLQNQPNGIRSIEVMIFKTNLSGRNEIRQIAPLLKAIPSIVDWSVDTEDVDNVLRIETRKWCLNEVINLITEAGFYCEELTD